MTKVMFDPEALDGHTIDELDDYLGRGRRPSDDAIEASPGCQIAMEALERLHALSEQLVESEPPAAPIPAHWMTEILSRINREAHMGRNVPLRSDSPWVHPSISEGALRGALRAVGDGLGGFLVGRIDLAGELDAPDAAATVSVHVWLVNGYRVPGAVEQLRHALQDVVTQHTDLRLDRVDIEVQDLVLPPARKVGAAS